MKWFVRDAEREYGPYLREQLAEFILPIHQIRGEGSEEWEQALEVAELQNLFSHDSSRTLKELWTVETSAGDEIGPITTESLKELIFYGRVRLNDKVKFFTWDEARILKDTSLVSRIGGDLLFRATVEFRTPDGRNWSFSRLLMAASRTSARAAMKAKIMNIARDKPVELTDINLEEGRKATPYT